MKKIIRRSVTPDGYPYHIVREQNYKFNILLRFYVYVYSLTDKNVVIFTTYFRREVTANAFAESFNYQEQIKSHLRKQLVTLATN